MCRTGCPSLCLPSADLPMQVSVWCTRISNLSPAGGTRSVVQQFVALGLGVRKRHTCSVTCVAPALTQHMRSVPSGQQPKLSAGSSILLSSVCSMSPVVCCCGRDQGMAGYGQGGTARCMSAWLWPGDGCFACMAMACWPDLKLPRPQVWPNMAQRGSCMAMACVVCISKASEQCQPSTALRMPPAALCARLAGRCRLHGCVSESDVCLRVCWHGE